MSPTRLSTLATAALAIAVLGASAAPAAFTTDFRLQDCRWKTKARNPYFLMLPGFRLVLEGEDEEEGTTVRTEITVLDETEFVHLDIAGEPRRIKVRVIEERESEDGELTEVSRNLFARCAETNAIYYFGEEVDIYEDGEVVGHDGAWRAGEDGSQPGLIMPGTFLLGAKYYQEVAPGVAEDRGHNVEMGLEVPTPAGTFDGCVAVIDTNGLDPESEDLKIYCPGIGLTVDEELVLIEYGRVAR